MNIVRTKVVELTDIPAIAYKQKISTGGAGIKIIRLDNGETALGTMDKRTGEAIPYGVVNEKEFPQAAFDEAVELTSGLPYSARGNVVIHGGEHHKETHKEDVKETDAPEKMDMVDSDEYKAIVSRYTDEKGKLNYALMNKDFIQYAAKSKTVEKMIAEHEPREAILLYILKNRAAHLANKKEYLTDEEAQALLDTLDEIDPRSAFKELNAYLNRMMARRN